MKGVKGKLLKKLKTIRSIGYLKPDRVLQVSASDGFDDDSPMKPNSNVQTQLVIQENDTPKLHRSSFRVQEPEVIDVSDLMRDLEDEEMESNEDDDDKENTRPETNERNLKNSSSFKKGKTPLSEIDASSFRQPEMNAINLKDSSSFKPLKEKTPLSEIEVSPFRQPDFNSGSIFDPILPAAFEPLKEKTSSSEIDVSSFRRPDLNSGSLFDPNLLAAFEQAVIEMRALEAERGALEKDEQMRQNSESYRPLKARRIDNDNEQCKKEDTSNPLLEFEEKCPPGGGDSVIFYTTGLRGIRKTFEECQSIRFLLESFKVLFFERDVSMHLEFRDELWRTLGEKVVPPRLFIKGRYIGGADKVLTLHEQGRLRPLLEGVPVDRLDGPCAGCGGVRFIMCFKCNGSQRVVGGGGGDDGVFEKCVECNENGLIICPLCC